MPRAATSSGSADGLLRLSASALAGAAVAILAAAVPFGLAFEDSDDPTRLYAIFGVLLAVGTILLASILVLVYRQLRDQARFVAITSLVLALAGLVVGGVWAHGYAFVGLPPLVVACVLTGVLLRHRAPAASVVLALVVPAAAVAFVITDTDWASVAYTISIPGGYGWALLALQRP